MRKRVQSLATKNSALTDRDWLDLEGLAQVEVTSEDSTHPVESALLPGAESGWRAALPGKQTIRLIFDRPQALHRISLVFVEPEVARTQEFVLSWSPDNGRSFKQILRQQWNFSQPGSMQEVEDYEVELSGVTQLELTIVPDQRGGMHLRRWRGGAWPDLLTYLPPKSTHSRSGALSRSSCGADGRDRACTSIAACPR